LKLDLPQISRFDPHHAIGLILKSEWQIREPFAVSLRRGTPYLSFP